jgi:hypothetical protein
MPRLQKADHRKPGFKSVSDSLGRSPKITAGMQNGSRKTRAPDLRLDAVLRAMDFRASIRFNEGV